VNGNLEGISVVMSYGTSRTLSLSRKTLNLLVCTCHHHSSDLCHRQCHSSNLCCCHRHSNYFVTALLHIEILEPNSKLASKLCRAYKRNVKKVVLICHPERNSR
jgi:hypothetical protein